MNKKHNILFISSWYPNRITPTNGDFVQRHAEAVSNFCNIVFLHVVYDKYLNKRIEKTVNNLNPNYKEVIVYFGINNFKKIIIVRQIIKLLKYYLIYVSEFKKITRSGEKPDIIHSNIIWPVSLIAYSLKFDCLNLEFPILIQI